MPPPPLLTEAVSHLVYVNSAEPVTVLLRQHVDVQLCLRAPQPVAGTRALPVVPRVYCTIELRRGLNSEINKGLSCEGGKVLTL